MAHRGRCPVCKYVRQLVAHNVTGVWVCRGCVSVELAERLDRTVVIDGSLRDEISGATLDQVLQEA